MSLIKISLSLLAQIFLAFWRRKVLLLSVFIVVSFMIITLHYDSLSRDSFLLRVSFKLNRSTEFNPTNPLNPLNPIIPELALPVRFPPETRRYPLLNLQDDEEMTKSVDESSRSEAVTSSPESPVLTREPKISEKIPTPEIALSQPEPPELTNENTSNTKNLVKSTVTVHTEQPPITYTPATRLVHFDLKGAPPKVDYLISLFPLIRAPGATGILIEYEDMFPFTGSLDVLSAYNAYKIDDIKKINTAAEKNNLDIIPLIQTFGHLEFALKNEKYRHLRENQQSPMALCPLLNDSFAFVTETIDQIVRAHKNVKILHIGCDEVFNMAQCERCKNSEREDLYLYHVQRVSQYVRETYSLRVIIWDDMLRIIPEEKLREMRLGELVEPMIWVYTDDIYHFVARPMFDSFSHAFSRLHAASAYKGSFSETNMVPPVSFHLSNTLNWLQVMSEQRTKFTSFDSLVITGWQRYDHLAVLCELLPVSVPSLMINLITMTQGRFIARDVFNVYNKVMKCPTDSGVANLDNDRFLWKHSSYCDFPGANIFVLTHTVDEIIKKIDDYIDDVRIRKGWLTEYNVRHNLSSIFRIKEAMEKFKPMQRQLDNLVKQVRITLANVFDSTTVNEWIEEKLYPSIEKMRKLQEDTKRLREIRVWPRRPIPMADELKSYLETLEKSDDK